MPPILFHHTMYKLNVLRVTRYRQQEFHPSIPSAYNHPDRYGNATTKPIDSVPATNILCLLPSPTSFFFTNGANHWVVVTRSNWPSPKKWRHGTRISHQTIYLLTNNRIDVICGMECLAGRYWNSCNSCPYFYTTTTWQSLLLSELLKSIWILAGRLLLSVENSHNDRYRWARSCWAASGNGIARRCW